MGYKVELSNKMVSEYIYAAKDAYKWACLTRCLPCNPCKFNKIIIIIIFFVGIELSWWRTWQRGVKTSFIAFQQALDRIWPALCWGEFMTMTHRKVHYVMNAFWKCALECFEWLGWACQVTGLYCKHQFQVSGQCLVIKIVFISKSQFKTIFKSQELQFSLIIADSLKKK